MISVALVAGIVLGGCETKKEADARARAAYLAGVKQGQAIEKTANTIWMIGNVKNTLLPWTEDLTLDKAIVAAEYQGTADPSQIVVRHDGEAPVFVSAKQILKGFDMPLKPGDRVEIRP
jgi:hypothetical protein